MPGRVQACEGDEGAVACVGDAVVLRYADLVEAKEAIEGGCGASELVEQLVEQVGLAFGREGLGVLLVDGVPKYAEMRRRLLPFAGRLAALSEEEKAETVDRESFFQFGWSQGNEFLDPAKAVPDVFKGGFFANPTMDVPTEDPDLIREHPTCCHANVWPPTLPGLRPAFMALGSLIIDVGSLVGMLCDIYVRRRLTEDSMHMYPGIPNLIRESRALKARLLYYFPRSLDAIQLWKERTCAEEDAGVVPDLAACSESDVYCNWHTDISGMTGLTGAIWERDDGSLTSAPDRRCGLHIKNREGEQVKVMIPPTAIAYQIGKTAELVSGGLLCATPHSVFGPKGADRCPLARSTFAVFMQPNWDHTMRFPTPKRPEEAALSESVRTAWREGQAFSQFMTALLQRSY